MKNEEIEELIGLYFSKDLPISERLKIRNDLLTVGYPVEELDSLADLDEELSNLPDSLPSADMSGKFYQWLEQEKNNLTGTPAIKGWRTILQGPAGRVAAGIALFVAGWLGSTLVNTTGGKHNELSELTAEVADLKQTLVLTKMEQPSSFDRITAVNMVNDLNQADEAVISSLLSVLIHDQNDNVRLAALESLLPYADSPVVREGLIRSIRKQNSPLVQLRLAEVMKLLQDPDAIPEIQEILKNSDLNYSVRTKYEETLESLI